MDSLANLFLGAFIFGLLFTVGSLVLVVGHLELGHGGLHFGGGNGAGIGHGAHGGMAASHGDGAHGAEGLSPWNVAGLTAFVAWFGGVGYLALTGWALAAWISLLL